MMAQKIIDLLIYTHISYSLLLECQDGLSEVKHVVQNFVIVLGTLALSLSGFDEYGVPLMTMTLFNFLSFNII